MRALAKTSAAPGLELVDVPPPRPGRHEVLIRVLRTGICGTDLHLMRWDRWARRTLVPPRIIGHEFVGQITAVGAGVGTLRAGMLVGGEGHLTCGRCARCRADERHLCRDAQGLGVHRDGVFADQLVLPAANVWVHGPGVPLDVAAVFDPFGNAVHVADTFDLRDRTVLVTGAGPIGAMAAAVAVHRGARLVAVTDTSPARLDLIRASGVHTVEARPGAVPEAAARLGLADGFDIGFEMSGSRHALADQLTTLTHGGRLAVLGLPEDTVPTDWAAIALRMLTVQGISGRRVFDTWHSMARLLEEGFDPSFTVTHRYPADEWEKAFARAADGTAGKVVVHWGEPE
ncbi:L-threonine 3-dehydrogenase [Streptomyces sp. NPDC097619]|uniref:L-threonine 3-dehydrogenase n=1 Tax=Streptomyces sp. NPDC097619 TaxID=3157228 RepID=UPI0033169EAC